MKNRMYFPNDFYSLIVTRDISLNSNGSTSAPVWSKSVHKLINHVTTQNKQPNKKINYTALLCR